jgi:PAS domain S-box-containing protein
MSGAAGAGREHLHTVLAHAAFGVAVTDPAGRIVEVNDACCTITGRSRPELLASDLPALTHPTDRATGTAEMDRVLRGEVRDVAVETRHVRSTGDDAWGRTTLSLVRDEAGAPLGIVALTVDITAERQAREALRDERAAMDAVEAVGRLLSGDSDLSAAMRRVTEAATKITGAAAGGLFYQVPEPDAEPSTAYAIFDGRRAVTETGVVTASGPGESEQSVLSRTVPGADDFVSYLVAPVTARGRRLGRLVLGHPDPGVFTERSRQLVATLAAQAAMALQVARLTDDEHQAREDIEHANQSRDELLSKLSHELRTPLNAILGWAVMMTSGALDEAARTRAASTIERNARNQLHLIEDLLDAPTAAEAARRLGMDGEAMNLAPLQGLRVLLVDDQPETVEVFVPTLTRRGAEVRIAASADEAMAIFAEWRPGVLVSDIAMPGEDGYALLRRVRALPADQGGEVPAVALTASGGARERKRALSAGFHSHVPKPVDRIELALTIANVVTSAAQAT